MKAEDTRIIAWRKAAEICCRVQRGLGFGYVSLHGGAEWPLTMVLTWHFQAGGDHFSASYSMADEYLDSLQAGSIDFKAAELVRLWKQRARVMVAERRSDHKKILEEEGLGHE